MANEEQLKILKQGVEVWNEWRKKHPDVDIDLAKADLAKADLAKADLAKVDLAKADLAKADLREADLRWAHLIGAYLEGARFQDVDGIPEWIRPGLDVEGRYSEERLVEAIRNGFKNLHGANLSHVDLIEARLEEADLRHATLDGADLYEAKLIKADLVRANLREANLNRAELRGADLRWADLVGAYLLEANLTRADLKGADLAGANLRGANLYRVDLFGASLDRTDLSKVRLSYADLIKANLTQATITGVNLYGTARDDWKIDRVICDYVYWDIAGEARTPKDRDFRPGEFEELYKSLPTFEYYFEQGFTPLDPLIMDRVVQAINERQPEIELKLDSFHSRGQAHAVFTVLHKDYIEPTQQQIKADYERRLAALEGKQEQMMELITRFADNPKIIEVILGDKRVIEAKRDYLEHVQDSDVTTGNSETKGE